jgi:hypothetical protein
MPRAQPYLSASRTNRLSYGRSGRVAADGIPSRCRPRAAGTLIQAPARPFAKGAFSSFPSYCVRAYRRRSPTTCGWRRDGATNGSPERGMKIDCESLPCPCAKPAGDSGAGAPKPVPSAGTNAAGCARPSAVQNISFSKTKYPNIRRHFLDALRKGWPRTLVLNRSGADARGDRLLAPYPTRPGQDRDSIRRLLGAAKDRGSSEASIRPAGAPTCATCPLARTARTARRWAPTSALVQRHALSVRVLLALEHRGRPCCCFVCAIRAESCTYLAHDSAGA